MKLRLLDRLVCLCTGKTLATLDHERQLKETEAKRAAAKAEHERQMEVETFRRQERERKQQLDNEIEAANTKQVFARTKAAATLVSESTLAEYKTTLEKFIASFSETGQTSAKMKAEWLLKLVEKEAELLKMGFNKYVHRSKLVQFVKDHKTRAIQVVSAVDYLRVIPEEAKQAIQKTKHIFDDHIIVFTDHSIKAKAHAVRKQPDPILFGVFSAQLTPEGAKPITEKLASTIYTSSSKPIPVMSDRMYFLADWEDDQCDLTFDQLLEEGAPSGVTAGNLAELEDISKRVSGIVEL